MRNLIRETLLAAALLGAGDALADPVHSLVLAAQMDNASTVATLLGDGLSPNTTDPLSGEPVLQVALREGSNAVVRLLVADPHLDIEAYAPNGNTALMLAALKHNQAAVATLLARGAQVNGKGWTALHYAAAGGDARIVSLLIDKGAALNAEAPNGLTPLMMAASEGQADAVEVLLGRGADAAFVNRNGQSAREAALFSDRPDIARMIDAHLARRAGMK